MVSPRDKAGNTEEEEEEECMLCSLETSAAPTDPDL